MIKNPPANAEDMVWIPGSVRSPGEGNGNQLQYACPGMQWTEEPGRLQSMRLQKSQTQVSDYNNTTLDYSAHGNPSA